MSRNMGVDYSLYLVTDSTAAILGDRDLVEVVRAAVEGGTCPCSILRDCTSVSLDLLTRAQGSL